jgi:NAD(P)-dependent dehydrogenase (short-subunit alcohol dehydrogenase family)
MTTYFITGANRGLGLEFARQLSKRPETTIIATAREPEKAGELARLVHDVVPLDVASESSIAGLRERVKDRPIDVLINNAGVSGKAKTVAELGLEELQRVFGINAFGPMLVTRALLANLRAGKRKTVFNITSQLGSIANNTGGSTYSYRASKTALNQLTVSMANELRPEGFCCVVVHPGWVQTDMGGPNAPLTVEQSVTAMLKVLDGLTGGESGKFLNYDGKGMAW